MALSSRTVSFPRKSPYNDADITERLTAAFHEMVDSTEFIHTDDVTDTKRHSTIYKVPLFGDDCRLTFDSAKNVATSTSPTANFQFTDDFVFKVDGATEGDFGWLCQKLYEHRHSFKGIDMTNLRDQVFDHVNSKPPHPGYNADSAKLANCDTIDKLFDSVPDMTSHDLLQELSSTGFVVIDDVVLTSKQSYKSLGDYMSHKTGQSDQVRTDTVVFLERDDAQACGLETQFDILMGIAPYLNKNYNFRPFDHAPIAPASIQNPLTNPIEIQAAEYGKGDFYVAHSDNSWAQGEHLKKRNNFRSFTAILYCNDNWEPSDGGALRIYKDSTALAEARDAPVLCNHVDIIPKNGRLIIFDSTLIHSVEKVEADRFRRALTIWIKQPCDANIHGEVVDVPL